MTRIDLLYLIDDIMDVSVSLFTDAFYQSSDSIRILIRSIDFFYAFLTKIDTNVLRRYRLPIKIERTEINPYAMGPDGKERRDVSDVT